MTAPSLPVGHRIHNKYRIVGYLGGGVNGDVYEVFDEKQDILVALKLLNAPPPGGGAWFEAEILTGLRGEYILPILYANDEAGVPFIVTEVMRNGSTEDRNIPGVGLDPALAAKWIRQASIGVARIHDRRLLHTDIKPANLFLDTDNNVLVGDLGLASRMDAANSGHPAGSPETLAPEIALGLRTTVRSDVYSLGASLYQLLTGDWLNPSLRTIQSRPDTYNAVAHHTPTPIGDLAPHLPASLRNIVMKAVDPDPTNRFANPNDLAAALGSRPRIARHWTRNLPCAGHTICLTGTKPNAATITICAVPVGTRGRHVIESHRLPAGSRIGLPWPEVTLGNLKSRIRSRVRELT